MAQYGITHRCGHQSTQQIYGTNSHGERERQAKRFEEQLCTDCYRKEQLAKAQATSVALPSLVGSEKQIAWATTLRAKFVDRVDSQIKTFSAGYGAEEEGREATTILTAMEQARDNILTTHTDSRYWIDNRDDALKPWIIESNKLLKSATGEDYDINNIAEIQMAHFVGTMRAMLGTR